MRAMQNAFAQMVSQGQIVNRLCALTNAVVTVSVTQQNLDVIVWQVLMGLCAK